MIRQLARTFLAVATAFGIGGVMADEHGHHHHRFARDIDAFHAVLAPVWHARPGPERSRDACAKAPEMAALAKDIRSADARSLVAAVAALKSGCDAQSAQTDAALFDVHEAFHRLIDAKPAASAR